MKTEIKNLRRIRLELAVILASEPDGDHEVKQAVLKEFCKDPVIREVLKTYGVECACFDWTDVRDPAVADRKISQLKIHMLQKKCVEIPTERAEENAWIRKIYLKSVIRANRSEE